MNLSLKICVADDELDMRQYFQTILPRLGHCVVSAAENGKELIENCLAHQPDLVITDIKMPEMDGIEAAMKLYEFCPVPIILVSVHHDEQLIERAEVDHVLAYLIKPIKQADLEPAIALAMHRFSQFQALRKETSDLRQALEDRKCIERAKGILMKRAELDEPAAYRRLQKLASNKNKKLIDIACGLLIAEEAFQVS